LQTNEQVLIRMELVEFRPSSIVQAAKVYQHCWQDPARAQGQITKLLEVSHQSGYDVIII